MIYKLYRCGNKATGNPGKLKFIAKHTDNIELIYMATVMADSLLAWHPTNSIVRYGYRSYPGEPVFAISTHKETT